MAPLTAESSTARTYELLASLLAQCPQTIEILPGDGSAWLQPESAESPSSFTPFLFVENNLGVPQKILYKTYLYAVAVLQASRSALQGRSPPKSTLQALIASTSILILANPSHQTALNTRKRLITIQLLDPSTELHFIASLLSSQHCAKHAELWYHRRWLLSRAWDPQSQESESRVNLDPSKRLLFSQEALDDEMKLIARACELYPRNYFAWTHRTICMRSLLSDYISGTLTLDFPAILRHDIRETKQWISHHVSDHSAVHHLLTISLDATRNGDTSMNELVRDQALVDHAVSLVRHYPSYETLWLYVRGLLLFDPGASRAVFQQFAENFVQPLAENRGVCERDDRTNIALKYAMLYLDTFRRSTQVTRKHCKLTGEMAERSKAPD